MDKILIADDEQNIIKTISYILQNKNIQIIKANDGLSAWNLALKHKPILCLLDVKMPNMDGFTLCKKIRENRELNNTYIIF